MHVPQKTRIRDPGVRVVWMSVYEIFVSLADRRELLMDAAIQLFLGNTCALRSKGIIVFNPLIHLGLCGVVIGHQFLVLLLDRIIGRRRWGSIGQAGQVCECSRRVGCQDCAQNCEQKTVHVRKLACGRLKAKSGVRSQNADRNQAASSVGIQRMNGVAQPALDGVMPLGREHFAAIFFPHVKAINGGTFFGGNPGGRNVEVQLA